MTASGHLLAPEHTRPDPAGNAGPLVSILTPSFNQAQWLKDALLTVECQTYPHVEHIVMDGGSTDGSVELLREHASGRMRWRSEPDRGQADAVNKAFAESTGEIIGWVNSDDAYYDARVVADVVAFFQTHPDVAVVYGHTAQITADGRIAEILWKPSFRHERLKVFNYIGQPAAFIRRSALTDPMLDESFHFAMDYELWLRLAQKHRFARIDRVVAADRMQPARKTETMVETFHADVARLAASFGQHYPPYWQLYHSLYLVFRRFAGARFALQVPKDLAFTAPEDASEGLMSRQVLTRRQHWPEGFR